jgi:hypothetical protein
MGVDGVRDSLAIYVTRSDVDVKKKVKGLRVTRASLNGTDRQDKVIFVAQK